MLLIDPHSGTFLINRKFQKRPHVFAGEHHNEQSVLLDGEYFQASNTYLIFDLIMSNNESFVDVPFSERLRCAKQFLEHARLPEKSIRLKEFVDKMELKVLLDRTEQMSDGKYVFKSKDGKTNESDGLIFIPENENYLHTKRKGSLLKWKWKGLNTLDFRLVPITNNRDKIGLAAGGYDHSGDIVVKELELDDLNMSVVPGQIVECLYSKTTGCWIPQQVRHDKRNPNHITTVISTMETLIDGICEKQLLGVISPNTHTIE